MRRICIYFKHTPDTDRFFPGDRYLRPIMRKLLGRKRIGGVGKVFVNLCKSFDLLKVPYIVNLPFSKLKPDDVVIVLGVGKQILKGYNKPNKIIAGIALVTHPSEWPDLCTQYPVAKYLQHSKWANDIYVPYYKEKCDLWPVGIETEKWKPVPEIKKEFDFLIYNKVHWNYDKVNENLIEPIRDILRSQNLTFTEIRYGSYDSNDYKDALLKSKAMIFLSEHESQGIAYQECLSTNIPVFAWDQGKLIDHNYQLWGDADRSTSSVPFFDDRCGLKFKDLQEFKQNLPAFLNRLNQFKPREYILENLTLEKSGKRMLELINEVYK